MSRIGKKEIIIPKEVAVGYQGKIVTVEGPKGKLHFEVKPEVDIKIMTLPQDVKKILVSREKDDKISRSLQGTTRQRLDNMVRGVIHGWSKTLEVVGTGFRANLEGERLVLSLGFSHKLEISPPPSISFAVAENKIRILGADKELVGRIAAQIRHLRPPDRYKGKGIRYQGEQVKLKPGKAAKVGVGAPRTK